MSLGANTLSARAYAKASHRGWPDTTGEKNQVLPLVRAYPQIRGRETYWRLLARDRGRIPKETYDSILGIFSSAVIGENPRLFGFDFDNPLADAHQQGSGSHPEALTLAPVLEEGEPSRVTVQTASCAFTGGWLILIEILKLGPLLVPRKQTQ